MNRRTCLRALSICLISATCCVRQRTGDSSAGGVTGTGYLEMTQATDAEIARRVSLEMGRENRESKPQFLKRVIHNGSVTVQATTPPLRNNELTIHNGTVYTISYEQTVQQTAIRYHVTINHVTSSVSDSETVACEALPAVDREGSIED